MSLRPPLSPAPLVPPDDALRASRTGPLSDLLPPEMIVPRYDGRGVANVPATIGALLGTKIGTLPPLESSLWADMAPGVRRVVLLVVDALGYRQLGALLAADEPSADWLRSAGARVAPLTALFPSTTVATMATLWTGKPPVAHGYAGYRLWLREVGAVVNMIHLRPARKPIQGVDLVGSGAISVKRFLPGPTIAQRLSGGGAPMYAHIGSSIERSALTRMLYRGSASLTGFASLGDSMSRLRASLEATAGRRALVTSYWDGFDHLGHARGWDDPAWADEWSIFFGALRGLVFDLLSPAARRDTLVMLVADHGMVSTSEREVVLLSDHPALRDMLAQPPAGEARVPYLRLRMGAADEARAYLHERLPEAFHVVDVAAGLAYGLWGPGPEHPELRHRIGDLALIGRAGATLRMSRHAFRTVGRHGGLLPDEALVPLVAWRL